MNIALIGPMGIGKTTTAELLVSYRDYTRLSFADAVKDDVVDLLNYAIGGKEVNLLDISKRPITRATIEQYKNEVFRPFLQWYGTDFWRKFMGVEDFWLQRIQQKIEDSPPGKVVVDDCRFPNEATFLRELGFIIVKLERTVVSNVIEFKSHASETEINNIIPDFLLPLDSRENKDILRALDLAISLAK